jgi:hypothetical protein
VSVQEVHAVAVKGFAEGFAAANQLASRTGAILRWAALWVDPAEPSLRKRHSELVAHFGARLTPLAPVDPETLTVCLTSPTPTDVRDLAVRVADLPFAAHFSPACYVGEDGPDPPWIPFVDVSGGIHDDARVYEIELAGNAVPLTTSGDRPWHVGFSCGPMEASGWELRLVSIRDHMPRADLLLWLSEAMGVRVASIRPVT